jgi:oligoribonuclease NrnB/cAMP/cGMP phosphodiesterase (DHH superfamily)
MEGRARLDFNSDNDRYGEHDCASLTFEGRQVIWLDYHDRALICRSLAS